MKVFKTPTSSPTTPSTEPHNNPTATMNADNQKAEPPRMVITRSGETGTLKTSMAQALGGDCVWVETEGVADTGPEDVRFVVTKLGDILEVMGSGDNRIYLAGGSKYTDTEGYRKILEICSKGNHCLIQYHFLHVKAANRINGRAQTDFKFAAELLQNHLGNLVIFVAGPACAGDGKGIKAIVKAAMKETPSLNVFLWGPQHSKTLPSEVKDDAFLAYHFLHDPNDGKAEKLKAEELNAQTLKMLLPEGKVPIQHANFHQKCKNCLQIGDPRILPPCHHGPFEAVHGEPQTLRKHEDGICVQRHAPAYRHMPYGIQAAADAVDRVHIGNIHLPGFEIPGAAFSIMASVFAAAMVEYRCQDCHGLSSSTGCRWAWTCCGAIGTSAPGCIETQICGICKKDPSAAPDNCLRRCTRCSNNISSPGCAAKNDTSVKHDLVQL